MSAGNELTNSLRQWRSQLGWSQAELATRAGLSRSEVSAIEIGRVVPSTTAALRLARALQCTVEELFSEMAGGAEPLPWATGRESGRFWKAEAGGVIRRYACEALPTGPLETDEAAAAGTLPQDTIVIASCDPAASLLARRLERRGFRCLILTRPSRCALRLLRSGVVHAAGVHLGSTSKENVKAAQSELGSGHRLIRVAMWEEGLASTAQNKPASMSARALRKMQWIGRQPGAGARRTSDILLGNPRTSPAGYEVPAPDHRAVAQAIQIGLANVGVCVRLAAEEFGLTFQSVSHEAFDLCLRDDSLSDPRVAALLEVLQSNEYRRSLGTLAGIDSTPCGEAIPIAGRSR